MINRLRIWTDGCSCRYNRILIPEKLYLISVALSLKNLAICVCSSYSIIHKQQFVSLYVTLLHHVSIIIVSKQKTKKWRTTVKVDVYSIIAPIYCVYIIYLFIVIEIWTFNTTKHCGLNTMKVTFRHFQTAILPWEMSILYTLQ